MSCGWLDGGQWPGSIAGVRVFRFWGGAKACVGLQEAAVSHGLDGVDFRMNVGVCATIWNYTFVAYLGSGSEFQVLSVDLKHFSRPSPFIRSFENVVFRTNESETKTGRFRVFSDVGRSM